MLTKKSMPNAPAATRKQEFAPRHAAANTNPIIRVQVGRVGYAERGRSKPSSIHVVRAPAISPSTVESNHIPKVRLTTIVEVRWIKPNITQDRYFNSAVNGITRRLRRGGGFWRGASRRQWHTK